MELSIIQSKIYEIRGIRVMLDFDLAEMYQVETRALKQAVKRNISRFPSDFMFVLTEQEIDFMVSQFVIPSKKHLGGALPFAFTEQGVAMLSSVLRSEKAIDINITVMRAFVVLSRRDISLTACFEYSMFICYHRPHYHAPLFHQQHDSGNR